MTSQALQTNSTQLNARIFGFIFLCVASIFLVINSTTVAADDQAGNWVSKKYSIDGGWTISTSGDKTLISFDDGFKTKRGPDLKIFLSKQSINDVTGKTATSDAVLVAELKSNKGSQTYELPAGINLSDYQSLLIHCEEFSVLWGGAEI